MEFGLTEERNFASTSKSASATDCMIRTLLFPVVQRSWALPAGTESEILEPFKLKLPPSFSGLTKVQTLVLRVEELKSSETGAPGGRGLMVVGSEAESLLVLVSPPPETVAVLVTLARALAATFTVSAIAG